MTEEEDALAARARKRLGTLVKGKWRIDGLLGSGGMASVFSATHRNGSRVAIKILHVELSLDVTIRRRFRREGYAANAVAHPGVVRVIDDDVLEDGSAFLMMDLIEGESLEERLSRATLPSTKESYGIVHDVLDVLAAAHDAGVVHRDIKPANVFLAAGGGVKLLDFGVARMKSGSQLASVATHAGSVVGTPAFMAPEQALGRSEAIDARTDLWSVGALMFALFSGRQVHEGRTVNEQLVLAATRRAPSLDTVAPHADRPAIEIVARALAFEPEGRFQTAREMQAAVTNAQAALAGASFGAPSTISRPVVTWDDAVARTLAATANSAANAPIDARDRRVSRRVLAGVAATAFTIFTVVLIAWARLSATRAASVAVAPGAGADAALTTIDAPPPLVPRPDADASTTTSSSGTAPATSSPSAASAADSVPSTLAPAATKRSAPSTGAPPVRSAAPGGPPRGRPHAFDAGSWLDER